MIEDNDGDIIETKQDIDNRVIVQIKEGRVFASVSLTKAQVRALIANLKLEIGD